ncbi:MAG: MSHA biogenesis protein MshL [Enterobacterales bacterium]|jgi:MSHA biogenesis protein MshL
MIQNETKITRPSLSIKLIRLCLILPGSLFLMSCQNTLENKQPSLMEQQLTELIAIQNAQKSAKAKADIEMPPAEVLQALNPKMSTLLNDNNEEERFDLAVNNAPAKEFFIGLVEGSDRNVVVSPDVVGNITLDLKNISISLVMDIVRNIYGFEYSLVENVYEIYPAKLKTVMFQVNYLNIKRSGNSAIRVNSGEVADNYSSGPTNNRGNNSSNQNTQGGGNNTDSKHSTKIETTTENDFWKELTETLKLLIADNPKAQIIANPQTSMVIVRALPTEIRTVSSYLNKVQNVMHRQVLLEARFLEVILGDSYQAGIDWSSIAKVNTSNDLNFSQNGRAVKNPDTSSLLSGIFSASYQSSNFELMIDLLSTQGFVQVLSSPRISTLNNQKAVIKVGTDEFFVTDISSTTTAGGGTSTTSPDVTLTPFFSGIALDVTPQIDEYGSIILHVHPSISEVTDQEKILRLGDEEVSLPLAKSTIRESDSIIRAQSGQVVVIGGLMQTVTNDSDSGIPLLKDVAGVGNLFKQSNMKNRKTELIILIRPILVDDNTWGDYLKDSQQRVGGMRKNGG